MAHSVIVVRVPEAEPYVSQVREEFDPSAKLGMPPHITVLSPFMPPEHLTVAVLKQIGAIALEVRSFTFQVREIGQLTGALYLVPEPDTPFISLTKRFARQFPEYPPYRGQYDGFVPHLTVATGSREQQNLAHNKLLRSHGPEACIVSSCSEVAMLANSSGRWVQIHTFALGIAKNLDS